MLKAFKEDCWYPNTSYPLLSQGFWNSFFGRSFSAQLSKETFMWWSQFSSLKILKYRTSRLTP